MALYKLNVFHMHFTDDQGLRIEIKNTPNSLQNKQLFLRPYTISQLNAADIIRRSR